MLSKRRTTKAAGHASPLAFASLALQYYASGRFAAVALLIPISGHLLHHAVEMFLKAAVAHVVNVEELRLDFRRNLETLWSRFKVADPGSKVGHFDTVIRKLHRFESIRYPSVAGDDRGFQQLVMGQAAPANTPEPSLRLVLDDIDALVAQVCDVARLPLAEDFKMLGPQAQGIIFALNRHPLIGSKPQS